MNLDWIQLTRISGYWYIAAAVGRHGQVEDYQVLSAQPAVTELEKDISNLVRLKWTSLGLLLLVKGSLSEARSNLV